MPVCHTLKLRYETIVIMKSTVVTFVVKEYLGGVIFRLPTSVLVSFFQGMQAICMMNIN